MPNAQHAITTHCVRARLDSPVTRSGIVVALNAKPMLTVQRINSATNNCANWRVKRVRRAVKRHYARRKIIVPLAIVSLASAAIRTHSVRLSIFVAMHLVAPAPFARTTKAHSIALAAADTLAIHTMKAVDLHSNVNRMPIARSALNAFKIVMVQSVTTFANASCVDQTPIVYPSITSPSVIVGQVIAAKRSTFTSAVDHYQCRALCHPIAQPIRTAMPASVSRPVH